MKNLPKAAQNPPFSRYEKLWKYITWKPQELWTWNLPGLCTFMRPFIWQDLGATIREWQGVAKKSPKRTPKSVFLGLISWNFQYHIKNRSLCDGKYWSALLFQIFEESDCILGSYGQKTTKNFPKIVFFAVRKIFEHW